MRVRAGMPIEAREIAMAVAAGEGVTDEQRVASAGSES